MNRQHSVGEFLYVGEQPTVASIRIESIRK